MTNPTKAQIRAAVIRRTVQVSQDIADQWRRVAANTADLSDYNIALTKAEVFQRRADRLRLELAHAAE